MHEWVDKKFRDEMVHGCGDDKIRKKKNVQVREDQKKASKKFQKS